MKKLFIILLLLSSATLVGCMYRVPVQQGNIIMPDMLAQLKPGMSKEQVRSVMGTPVLASTFNSNRWDYVYTYKTGKEIAERMCVTLFFANDILQRVQRNS